MTQNATRPGKVTLVGAGPGEPEYLTLRAVRAMREADVILFDDLVAPEILEFARDTAHRILVGKRGGRVSCKQEDINAMMLRLARQGKTIVRLKSGDPAIFGRAGEEIQALQSAGIEVEIVPGITAASAMAATLGLSLTHRDHAHAVQFVTGHSRNGGLPEDVDWQAIARGLATTIFYMGARTAEAISARLIAEGMNPQTPATILASVSRPEQRHWTGTLATIATGVALLGLDAPILIGFGEVFAQPVSAALAQTG